MSWSLRRESAALTRIPWRGAQPKEHSESGGQRFEQWGANAGLAALGDAAVEAEKAAAEAEERRRQRGRLPSETSSFFGSNDT